MSYSNNFSSDSARRQGVNTDGHGSRDAFATMASVIRHAFPPSPDYRRYRNHVAGNLGSAGTVVDLWHYDGKWIVEACHYHGHDEYYSYSVRELAEQCFKEVSLRCMNDPVRLPDSYRINMKVFRRSKAYTDAQVGRGNVLRAQYRKKT